MKKSCASIALLALLLSAGTAHAVSVGAGAFGGMSFPLVQDDTGQGTVFGARIPVNVAPLLTVEPYYSSTSGGDAEEDFGTRTGLDVTGYGVNALLTFGTGAKLFPFAGLGSQTVKRSGQSDITKTAYNFGLGLSFGVPVTGLSLDVRGELNAMVDGDTSRKWANATVGLNYAFFTAAP
jgi:hypothetical protein